KDVVKKRIAGAGILDVDGPAGVRCHQDRVVNHEVVDGPGRGVDVVERNAAGMVVVQEIVLNDGRLEAVAIDARGAAGTVVVNDVVFDQGAGNESGAALAQVAVHVNAGLIIPKA